MLRKLGKKITNNLGLKILAAVCAVVLWLVVVNIDDPVGTKRITTSVTLVNEDYLTEQNKYFELLDGKNTVTFSVSAQRSIRDKLYNSDFTATADMEKIESYNEEEGIYRVPVTVSTSKYGSSDVTILASDLYLEVTLEDLGNVQKQIMASTRGTVADGCALGTVQIVGSNLIRISGPSSIVSTVDTVTATIGVDGMSSDVSDTVVPTLYDADGNMVDTTKLTLSVSTVTVSAEILNTKEVALEFQTTGEPADGYKVTEIAYTPQTVSIKGEPAVLNPVNKITIPAEVLDLTNITSDIVTTVDISAYLPSNTSLVDNSDVKVEVTVTVEPIITETYVMPVANLTVENLRDGYEVQFDTATVAVEISGAESDMEALELSGVTGTIDLSDLGEGEYEPVITFMLDEDIYEIVDAVSVPVTISVSAASGTTDNTTDENDADVDETDEDTQTGDSASESTSTGNPSSGTSADSANTSGGNASGSSGSTGADGESEDGTDAE